MISLTVIANKIVIPLSQSLSVQLNDEITVTGRQSAIGNQNQMIRFNKECDGIYWYTSDRQYRTGHVNANDWTPLGYYCDMSCAYLFK